MLGNLPVINSTFLGEPGWRWAVFVVMMGFFLWAWGRTLNHIL